MIVPAAKAKGAGGRLVSMTTQRSQRSVRPPHMVSAAPARRSQSTIPIMNLADLRS